MKSLYAYFILGLMAFSAIEVNARNRVMGVTIRQQQIEVNGSELYVGFDIDIKRLNLKSNQGVVLIPTIQAGGNIKTLPEVIVNGRNRQISYNRITDRKKKQISYTKPYAVIRNNKKGKAIISYKMVIPFEKWMRNATFSLTEDICGCRNAMQDVSNLLVVQKIEFPSVIPPALTYLSPISEPLTTDRASIASVVLFPESKSTILVDYGSNKSNINRLDSLLRGVAVESIHIVGAASPEGAYLFNEQLSRERALSLAAYFKAYYGISDKLDRIEWVGENWDSLLKLVERSDMQYKQQIIDIIKNTDISSERKSQLMKLNSGKSYRYMQEYFFPQLRSVSYTVHFYPVTLDIAKGRELIISDPKSLSANELLLVADSYPRNSTEYKNAIEITAKTYPENLVANINASSVAIGEGNISVAKQYLERFGQQPESWNNLGVISMIEGDYESAHQYLQKAINAGNVEAVRNMEELNHKSPNP